MQEDEQIVNLDCFEFASRCKKTNQPDYGAVYISYIPGKAREAVTKTATLRGRFESDSDLRSEFYSLIK